MVNREIMDAIAEPGNEIPEINFTQFRSMKEVPPNERPRERMVQLGAQSLRLDELLAIVLRTGMQGRSVLQVAQELMETYSLNDLAAKSPYELVNHQGLGFAKACELVAVFELARRLAQEPPVKRTILACPEEMAAFFIPRMEHLTYEELQVAYLNLKGGFLDCRIICRGGLSANIVEPAEVFRWALIHKAASIVLAHNHPSGDAEPSGEDLKLTRDLVRVGELFGVTVIDHLIIGRRGWKSLRLANLL